VRVYSCNPRRRLKQEDLEFDQTEPYSKTLFQKKQNQKTVFFLSSASVANVKSQVSENGVCVWAPFFCSTFIYGGGSTLGMVSWNS
jgi:predicted branched-subunit amino acid permease